MIMNNHHIINMSFAALVICIGLVACDKPKEQKEADVIIGNNQPTDESVMPVDTHKDIVGDIEDSTKTSEESEIIEASDTNTSEDLSDLMEFYGVNISEVLEVFPDLEYEESVDGSRYSEKEEKSFDGLSLAGPFFDVDEDDMVTGITYGGTRYSVANIYPGVDFKEASGILKNDGWKFEYGDFAHGTATYYAVYVRNDTELCVSTDGTGEFGALEENEITGIVNNVIVYRHEEEEATEPARTEVFGYLTDYKDLVKLLDMMPYYESSIQLGDAFTSHQFFLEYDDMGDFSMTNEASPYVSLCEIIPGDSTERIPGKMKEYGFKKYYDEDDLAMYSYLKDDILYAALFYKESGVVSSWYFCNWPEGEDALGMWEQWE